MTAVRRMKMKAIPKIDLTIDVPLDEVARYLREGSSDSRIDSVARELQIDAGTDITLTEREPLVFAYTDSDANWFGTTELTCLYALTDAGNSRTHVEIQVSYAMPWLLRSVFAWPYGDMMVDAIKVGILSTVSALVALEKGTAMQMQDIA